MLDPKKLKKLEQLYSQIPAICCKGLCYTSCSIIPASKIEMKIVKEKHQINPFYTMLDAIVKVNNIEYMKEKFPVCQALVNGRCTIYSDRPAICRLYGVVENMQCEFGCIPEKMLTAQQGYDLIEKIENL